MISQSAISEIHPASPANCQMTAADVAAIAMIRNNMVWIHGLIKHCLRSWTDKLGHFYACICEMTGQGPPGPKKHVYNFDVTCATMQVRVPTGSLFPGKVLTFDNGSLGPGKVLSFSSFPKRSWKSPYFLIKCRLINRCLMSNIL